MAHARATTRYLVGVWIQYSHKLETQAIRLEVYQIHILGFEISMHFYKEISSYPPKK